MPRDPPKFPNAFYNLVVSLYSPTSESAKKASKYRKEKLSPHGRPVPRTHRTIEWQNGTLHRSPLKSPGSGSSLRGPHSAPEPRPRSAPPKVTSKGRSPRRRSSHTNAARHSQGQTNACEKTLTSQTDRSCDGYISKLFDDDSQDVGALPLHRISNFTCSASEATNTTTTADDTTTTTVTSGFGHHIGSQKSIAHDTPTKLNNNHSSTSNRGQTQHSNTFSGETKLQADPASGSSSTGDKILTGGMGARALRPMSAHLRRGLQANNLSRITEASERKEAGSPKMDNLGSLPVSRTNSGSSAGAEALTTPRHSKSPSQFKSSDRHPDVDGASEESHQPLLSFVSPTNTAAPLEGYVGADFLKSRRSSSIPSASGSMKSVDGVSADFPSPIKSSKGENSPAGRNLGELSSRGDGSPFLAEDSGRMLPGKRVLASGASPSQGDESSPDSMKEEASPASENEVDSCGPSRLSSPVRRVVSPASGSLDVEERVLMDPRRKLQRALSTISEGSVHTPKPVDSPIVSSSAQASSCSPSEKEKTNSPSRPSARRETSRSLERTPRSSRMPKRRRPRTDSADSSDSSESHIGSPIASIVRNEAVTLVAGGMFGEKTGSAAHVPGVSIPGSAPARSSAADMGELALASPVAQLGESGPKSSARPAHLLTSRKHHDVQSTPVLEHDSSGRLVFSPYSKKCNHSVGKNQAALAKGVSTINALRGKETREWTTGMEVKRTRASEERPDVVYVCELSHSLQGERCAIRSVAKRSTVMDIPAKAARKQADKMMQEDRAMRRARGENTESDGVSGETAKQRRKVDSSKISPVDTHLLLRPKIRFERPTVRHAMSPASSRMVSWTRNSDCFGLPYLEDFRNNDESDSEKDKKEPLSFMENMRINHPIVIPSQAIPKDDDDPTVKRINRNPLVSSPRTVRRPLSASIPVSQKGGIRPRSARQAANWALQKVPLEEIARRQTRFAPPGLTPMQVVSIGDHPIEAAQPLRSVFEVPSDDELVTVFKETSEKQEEEERKQRLARERKMYKPPPEKVDTFGAPRLGYEDDEDTFKLDLKKMMSDFENDKDVAKFLTSGRFAGELSANVTRLSGVEYLVRDVIKLRSDTHFYIETLEEIASRFHRFHNAKYFVTESNFVRLFRCTIKYEDPRVSALLYKDVCGFPALMGGSIKTGIDYSQFARAVRYFLTLKDPKERLKYVFHLMDSDGSKSLTVDEFIAIFVQPGSEKLCESLEVVRGLFRVIDEHDSGYITPQMFSEVADRIPILAEAFSKLLPIDPANVSYFEKYTFGRIWRLYATAREFAVGADLDLSAFVRWLRKEFQLPSQSIARRLFFSFNADNEGNVSFGEVLQGLSVIERRGLDDETRRLKVEFYFRMFRPDDSEEGVKLSDIVEFVKEHKYLGEDVGKVIIQTLYEFDDDGNGVMTFEEFSNAVLSSNTLWRVFEQLL